MVLVVVILFKVYFFFVVLVSMSFLVLLLLSCFFFFLSFRWWGVENSCWWFGFDPKRDSLSWPAYFEPHGSCARFCGPEELRKSWNTIWLDDWTWVARSSWSFVSGLYYCVWISLSMVDDESTFADSIWALWPFEATVIDKIFNPITFYCTCLLHRAYMC